MGAFVGRRRISDGILISLTIGAALPYGAMIGKDTTDLTKGVVADTTATSPNFVGHLSQPTKVGGPTLDDLTWPDLYSQPVAVGGQVTLDRFQEIEAEGPAFILQSGTGALTSGTAIGTLLSVKAGVLHVVQAGENATHRLTQVLTPETAGNVRIVADLLPAVVTI